MCLCWSKSSNYISTQNDCFLVVIGDFRGAETLICSYSSTTWIALTHERMKLFHVRNKQVPVSAASFPPKSEIFFQSSCCLSQFLCFCIHPPWTHHFLHNVPSIFSHLSGSRSREQQSKQRHTYLHFPSRDVITPACLRSIPGPPSGRSEKPNLGNAQKAS